MRDHVGHGGQIVGVRAARRKLHSQDDGTGGSGWDDDVLPVRLSAAELAGVLALPDLPDVVRTLLVGGAVS